jgi:hypothetical protein
MSEYHDWLRLQQIHEEMNDLLEEAKQLVRKMGANFIYERAKAYWLTSIDNNLNCRQLVGVSMDQTIEELTRFDDDKEVEEDGDFGR